MIDPRRATGNFSITAASVMTDRLDALAKSVAARQRGFREIAGVDAVCAALQGNHRRFVEALQKNGSLDLDLEDREDAQAVTDALSTITPLSADDLKALMNCASVKLTLSPTKKIVHEKSVEYDKEGRITRIVDTPMSVGTLKIEVSPYHSAPLEDD